jgi:uncharacterized pyridoxal phosphate-containing UPF0001 family protein
MAALGGLIGVSKAQEKKRTRESISHGRTRNFTEKEEAETRKKTEAVEAFATE